MKAIEIYIFFIGLCIGSFLNVCVFRIIKNQSVVWPSSYCDNCGAELKPLDLIPVISYVLLRGRCRVCKEKISIQYPLVELLNAVLYIGLYEKYGLSFYFVKYSTIISIMIVSAIIDIKTYNVYINISIFALICGIIFDIIGFIFFDIKIATYLYGMIVIYLVLLSIELITRSMGRGDVYMASICGLFLGIKFIILTMIIAIILGGVTGVLFICFKCKDKKDKLPFIPFIAVGAIMSMFIGDYLINWYLNLYLL